MFAGWSWRVSGDLGCFWYLGWGGEGRSFSFLLLVSSCRHLGIVPWASLILGKGCLVVLGRFLEELWLFSWSWEFSGACWSKSGIVMRVTNYSHVNVSELPVLLTSSEVGHSFQLGRYDFWVLTKSKVLKKCGTYSTCLLLALLNGYTYFE